ncbi:hypothetical protein AV530_011998 [Patagioenas fasciata monilis]|uniref:Uncharacterized protein n=1 Tax=Patagioenas fasciata monilis TaxID=372326 RepID=A0A1V4JUK3_PATFA|nr:hypothetical protein AV530_011998 [Patagioenas fasciata monilis]
MLFVEIRIQQSKPHGIVHLVTSPLVWTRRQRNPYVQMNGNEHCQRGKKIESLLWLPGPRAAGANCVNGILWSVTIQNKPLRKTDVMKWKVIKIASSKFCVSKCTKQEPSW